MMAVAMKLSDKLVSDAKLYAKAKHRTPPEQIEYYGSADSASDSPRSPMQKYRKVI